MMTKHTWIQLAGAGLATLLFAGCVAVTKVETGQTVVSERLVLNVASSWNRFERGQADNTPTWTKEGITVDALQFYVGVKEGQVISSGPRDSKDAPLTFKAGMQPAEVVALFQAMHTRTGSTFSLDKLEPTEFVGSKGFRYEFSVTRKVDDVMLRGVAYGAIRNGELFVISYTAPRLAFFAKYVQQVEALARGATVKG